MIVTGLEPHNIIKYHAQATLYQLVTTLKVTTTKFSDSKMTGLSLPTLLKINSKRYFSKAYLTLIEQLFSRTLLNGYYKIFLVIECM